MKQNPEDLKKTLIVLLMFLLVAPAKAQIANWQYKDPVITINFGSGNVGDINTIIPYDYEMVEGSCPQDGYYAYSPYTRNCFNGDWFTLTEDHTPGDANGNMMIVNSSYNEGMFFQTPLTGLKVSTTYEFSVWIMNVCRISDQCPYPLLPYITMELKTPTKSIAKFSTGVVFRQQEPVWKLYRAIFTTLSAQTDLTLSMVNSAPGGCGNDFALDDISVRECIIPVRPFPLVTQKKMAVKNQPIALKQPVKKATNLPVTPKPKIEEREKTRAISTINSPLTKQEKQIFPPPPAILSTRTNTLIKQIEAEAGEIVFDLYDNGEIDGDTVSVYHNNVLLVSKARLSQKPITFRINVNTAEPHHELVMVAENLGTIPPNTSVMIVNAGGKRYQVFITSTEQNNAKVVLDLKE